MFEDLFHQLDKELGPLNPDWFEELTAKVSRDEAGPDISKYEEEERAIKTAEEASVLASQLFSTPKIFKLQHVQSPDLIPDEDSPYLESNGVSAAFPWTDSSPCLFGSAKNRLQPSDCFGLLETPKRSSAHSAKRISESLGAQINPDLSWSSSFNTPSSMTPTVILPKTEDRPTTATCLKDKEAIFVRTLFPSLSKDSENNVALRERSTTVKQDVITRSETIQADGLEGKANCSPDASLDTNGFWRQTVPSAIEDGDVRSTVQDVLNGAEDVLSIFFSNSTSALRRVKTKERIQRRINDSSKEVKSTAPTLEPDNELGVTRIPDLETKRPEKNEDVMQWTPLSLSDSSLNEGLSSGLSSLNNHTTVASNETNGGLVNGTLQCSQIFSSGVERLSCHSNANVESPAFALTKKPRKFVYQVHGTDLKGVKQKAASVFSQQTLTEKPSEEKTSNIPNESRFVTEDAVSQQTQPQDVTIAQMTTEPHDLDQGLDMTQLSKAFAEDFTQEMMTGVRSYQNSKFKLNAQIQRSQMQPKAESEQKKDDINQETHDNHNESSALADVSSSPQTLVLPTCEISRDSGCPTTFAELDEMTVCTGTTDNFSGFKTANNRIISVSHEAIIKAKASLDEAIANDLSNTVNEATPKHKRKVETLYKSVSENADTPRSSLVQSSVHKNTIRTCINDALSSPGLLSSKLLKQNIPSCSSPESSETASEKNIAVSDASHQEAGTLLNEVSEKDSTQYCKLEIHSAERQTTNYKNAQKPTMKSSHDDVEKNCPLTASQKADVTALCSLLEEADSQYEFTQIKPTKLGSDNHSIEREWDPDILNGIDFDDSFNCDVMKGKQQVKTEESLINNSVQHYREHGAQVQTVDVKNICTISEKTTMPLTMKEGNLGDGIKNVWDELSNFSDKSQIPSFGFKTATGKDINISEKSLQKSKQFFEEDEIYNNRKNNKAENKGEKSGQLGELSEMKPLDNTNDGMDKQNKTNLLVKQDVHFSSEEVNAALKDFEVSEHVTQNAGTLQSTDVCVNSVNSLCGFKTARGEKLEVSETVLFQAKRLFNDVGILEESETQEPPLYNSGKHDCSVSTASLKKTKAVSWSKGTPENHSDPVQFAETVNHVSNVVDIPSCQSKEQKSGNDAKEIFTQMCSSKNYLTQSIHGYGFQTASGKGVTVSARALKKAKDVFQDCDENINCSGAAKMGEKSAKLSNVEISSKINRFITANVTLTEEAQKNAVDSNRKVDFSVEANSDKPNESYSCMKTCGDWVYGCEKPSLDQQPPPEEGCQQILKEFNKDLQSESFKNPSKLPPPNSSCGFKTASGRKVLVSAEALQRAKDVLSESVDAFPCVNGSRMEKQIVNVQKDQTSASGKCNGFCTAGGKKVTISPSALQMAKSLFKDCQEESLAPEEILKEVIPETRILPVMHKGFCTAGGRKVTVSSSALHKARSLFKDCEDESLAPEELAEKVTPVTGVSSGKQNGFCTAGGKKVAVSSSALQKAKNLFKDCEEDSLAPEGLSEKVPAGTGRFSTKHEGFCTAGGRKVAISSSALHRAKNLFEDCTEAGLASHVRQHQSSEGFSTASDKAVSEKSLSEVKAAFAPSDDTFSIDHKISLNIQSGQQKYMCRKINLGSEKFTSETGSLTEKLKGFCTAGGKKVAVSASALQKAKSLFKDCEEDSLAPEEPSEKVTSLTGVSSGTQNGFCTAGGTKVAVSASALQKAKSLFKDCEEDSLAPEELSEKVPTGRFSAKHKGFCTAGGKKVTISSSALDRAKSLFKDCEEESLAPEEPSEKVTSLTGVSSGTQNGFCTAGGTKVAVSASALQKAKSIFKDCEEDSLAPEELASKKAPSETGSSYARSEDIGGENLKCDQLNMKNYGFSTASGRDVPVSKIAFEEASKLFIDCDIPQITDMDNQPLQTNSSERLQCNSKLKSDHGPPIMLDDSKDGQAKTILQPLPSKVTQNEPAQLDLHSLDFSNCTETQQEYFEQEAMACTKALLADDDLNDKAGLSSSEGKGCTKSLFVHNLQTDGSLDVSRRRKRQLDASSLAEPGPPPLKRQLLSEFDQTLNCTKSLPTTPLKSCPNGTLRDRRVFKYSVHLQPNVTRPDRNSMDQKPENIEQHVFISSIQNRGQSDNKGRVFVPPFRKSMKTETPRETSQAVSKTSSDFLPPFRKEESKNKISPSKELEKNMMTLTPTTDSVSLCGGEKNLQMASKAENISVKRLDCEERETKAWLEAVQLARDMQDMRLRKKKRQTIRPLPGSLYLTKNSGVSRISLRHAVGHKCPGQYSQEELYQHGVHSKVSYITSETAESFRFDCDQFFKREVFIDSGAVQLADGGWLVPDDTLTVGKEEFYRALCDTPGVDPKLITEAWVFNHYRWIVWKQASMERTFPDVMGSQCLTPEQVLLQLKFRYDVEVDHSRRSALRRIVERDDTPAKTLVLCVCGVANTSQNPLKPLNGEGKTPDTRMESAVVWLTDGWYAIKGLLDLPLSAMLHKGRLRIGDKIMIHGAELVGSQEASPPLEAPESLMLKISANSTRRVKWDTKLGYYRDPRPFRLPLSSLYADGGVVSCVDIVVLRSYPTQWMEKKPNGVFVFRNDRAEDREARRHNSTKHKTMELLVSNMQAQFEKELEDKKIKHSRRRRFSRHEIEDLQDGEELYEAISCDPAVETYLSERQMEAVSKHRCCIGERRNAELQERVRKAMMEAQEAEGGCPDRDVTPVWKLSVTDSTDLQSSCVYTLNIWRPSAELYSLLKEGRRYRAYHLTTSEGKKRSDTANIQLTATKKTLFRDVEVSPEWHFRARECTSFRELPNPQFSSPCGEVDIVGYIVSIVGKQGNSAVLYLVDEKFDVVSVRTSSSLEQLAVEELINPGALVAISNLQLRQLSGHVPGLYAGEQALFSINPKEPHLQHAMSHLKNCVQTCENFHSIAEEKVSDVVPSGVFSFFQSPRTPGAQSTPKMNGRVNVTPVFSPFTPVSKRTPISANNSEIKDPKSLKRKRGLDYLARIPSPPPIAPLSVKASPCVNKTFNPPRRSVTPKPPPQASRPPPLEEEWGPDEELAMIDTQALLDGLKEG